MRARQWAHYGRWGYVGLDWMPYQLAVGLSLRWLGGAPQGRIYVGPVKLYAGLSERRPLS